MLVYFCFWGFAFFRFRFWGIFFKNEDSAGKSHPKQPPLMLIHLKHCFYSNIDLFSMSLKGKKIFFVIVFVLVPLYFLIPLGKLI